MHKFTEKVLVHFEVPKLCIYHIEEGLIVPSQQLMHDRVPEAGLVTAGGAIV